MRFNEQIARQVADVARLLYSRGLTQVKGGNVSVYDRSEGLVYITPTGVPRHLIKEEDIAIMRIDGTTVVGTPSSEYRLHLSIYRDLQNSIAVVHAHPADLIALYEAGLTLDIGKLMEAAIRVGCVTDVPALPPGTEEIAAAAAEALRSSGCRAAVLRRHGVVAYSEKDAYEALDAVESLADAARITLLSRTDG
ncbi:MAG: class II aldolase/adducin family protein [Acidilobus sp.]